MVNDAKRGPLGDARPDADENGTDIRHSLAQENVEDRENVGTVEPDDYPNPALAGVDRAQNRGKPPSMGSGEVHGSGAGAGGGGVAEDYDDDPQGGGGKLQQNPMRKAPDTKGDAPIGGSR
jgi:hypothetical protein